MLLLSQVCYFHYQCFIHSFLAPFFSYFLEVQNFSTLFSRKISENVSHNFLAKFTQYFSRNISSRNSRNIFSKYFSCRISRHVFTRTFLNCFEKFSRNIFSQCFLDTFFSQNSWDIFSQHYLAVFP